MSVKRGFEIRSLVPSPQFTLFATYLQFKMYRDFNFFSYTFLFVVFYHTKEKWQILWDGVESVFWGIYQLSYGQRHNGHR